MNPFSEDVKNLIVAESLGTFGTNLFISVMPDTPDACIGLYDYTAAPPDVPDIGIEYPAVQVRVRGDVGGYRTAWEKAYSIKTILHGKHEYTVGSTKYLQITCESDIVYVGLDERKRPLFTMSFHCQRG